MKIILIVLLVTITTSCGYPFEPYVEPKNGNDIEIINDTTTNEYTITIEI